MILCNLSAWAVNITVFCDCFLCCDLLSCRNYFFLYLLSFFCTGYFFEHFIPSAVYVRLLFLICDDVFNFVPRLLTVAKSWFVDFFVRRKSNGVTVQWFGNFRRHWSTKVNYIFNFSSRFDTGKFLQIVAHSTARKCVTVCYHFCSADCGFVLVNIGISFML